ncbi:MULTISPECIES: glycosyl transferase family 90 [unclassified Mesorhizobium]|uniref:glycosyl transferase family 90 n=1 Tax=unclassified Mesorhizobium TaxID=325217 RepID=UPI000BAE9EC0|nr:MULTISPECIES: glycosyl transferase family 90 [unclassified Mesorhizobium]TGT60163.1 lipopolysaccharide biosynthesis protein [Mesorhizobium sp. M00.F.Ca.ET.170.01.1.1]AZO08326.1 lipopolysaccharide biosynthesis protein [Mesorhizobium sp. M3A.F.Ca.ET.080.04.2.1]PBB84614.1 lipopolysaccharide biosynthesis protein [Mesorhizobium sp. WSM3876]RWB72255.1 MAG: lipopolysaccharide biosynthesis protein [Mesorhizobium sp.]RWB89343.1 MAG: lipopolysaccharide biosynthesis protein [Mesorhizobium sp.]
MASPLRTAARVFYFIRNITRDVVPQALFRRRLASRLQEASLSGETIRNRVNYYNRLEHSFVPSPTAVPAGRIPSFGSMYYYDLKEFARYFDRDLLIDVQFGDLAHVPKMPSIVKDRPIGNDNANAVIMKLDKFRHFRMPADRLAFADKRPMVVWRGHLNNPIRARFIDAVRGLPICDAGSPKPEAPAAYRKPYLTIPQQRKFRYIVSLEGNDVATNLKWIMSSNSLCLMPPPKYETWFAEAEIEANVHYVPLASDFSDVADKVAYYEKHPAEAQRIVAAAHAYCRRFHNEREESTVSLLVLYKYFVLSGQIEPDPQVWRYITG